MNDRSGKIIKQLNRLANDRSLPMQARNKINDAARHIRELQHIQAEFVQTAIDQYQAETGKLVEMSSNALAEITGRKWIS